MILVDSGPLVPAGALNDPHHRGAPTCSALQPRNCSCLSKPGTSEVHRHCSAPVKPAFGRVLAHRDTGPAEAL